MDFHGFEAVAEDLKMYVFGSSSSSFVFHALRPPSFERACDLRFTIVTFKFLRIILRSFSKFFAFNFLRLQRWQWRNFPLLRVPVKLFFFTAEEAVFTYPCFTGTHQKRVDWQGFPPPRQAAGGRKS